MKTLEYRDDALWLIDQTRLPLQIAYVECRDHESLCESIKMLRVRGAPAIGIAAGYGVLLAAERLRDRGIGKEQFHRELLTAIAELRATRPTAVNLGWALDRMSRVLDADQHLAPDEIVVRLRVEADRISIEDDRANRAMGKYGAELLPDGANVLTHCNAGGLATGEYGTALGVIMAAHRLGKRIHVWVDETRPLLQGARLTAWELEQENIPYTLITDNMAAHFMARGQIDAAMVGADRIAANGDAANKIGTYGVATLARAHHLPFYVVAPASTIDLSTPTGEQIVIEERDPREVTSFAGIRVAPPRAQVANPAFDVTPARLITGIVTETGIAREPYLGSLANAVRGSAVGV